jgi:PD-(D/E)XK nuclease superfamily protein
MRSDDHRADNLLLRLFSYTPRMGRLPLEDFCTEALAWCLRNCGPFRVAFLKSLNLNVKDGGPVAITTQNSYEYEDDEGSGDEGFSDAGRFDLIIQLGDNEIMAIIETKVGSPFGVEQLLRYREEMKRQQRALGFKRGILITLTDKTGEPKGADIHRTWSVVQRLLERQLATIESSDHAAKVCMQFAEFLKEKGLGSMNVPKIAAEPLNQWVIGMKFRSSLEDLLRSVKNDSEIVQVFGRKRIVFEDNEDGTLWIGMYGNQQNFWLGFGFRQKAGKTQVFLLVQKAVNGDRKREFPKLKPEYADGKTWLNIERTLDRELDGNGEKIKEWLLDSSKWLLKIK